MGAMQEIALDNKLKRKPQAPQPTGGMMTRKDFLQILKDLPPEPAQRSVTLGALG